MPEAERPVEIALHPRQVGPVLIDEALRLLPRQTGIAREPVRLHAVDDPEVDRLGDAAHVRRDLFPGDAMDQGRRHAVDILAPRERIDQERLAAHVRQQPQLDLRIVGGDQHRIIEEPELRAVIGDERAPHAPPQLGADRDVLQVRIGRREAAGRRDRLVERRVDAPGARIDLQRQRVDVGRLQLGQGPVLQDQVDDRVLVAQCSPAPRNRRRSRSSCAVRRAVPALRRGAAPVAGPSSG